MDTKMWIPRPAGTGTGVGKQFVFYALAVPTTGVSQTMTFDVTYPDPMNPNTTITKTYSAQYDGLEYRAGHCTTIHISLNHQDGESTVGAEYMDWQDVETPDPVFGAHRYLAALMFERSTAGCTMDVSIF